MKAGPLVVGIFILVIGAFGYITASNMMSQDESTTDQTDRFIIKERELRHQAAVFGQLGSVVLVVTGFGVFIYGVVSRGHKKVGKYMNDIDILKERYARGEITKEEFNSMKKDLKWRSDLCKRF